MAIGIGRSSVSGMLLALAGVTAAQTPYEQDLRNCEAIWGKDKAMVAACRRHQESSRVNVEELLRRSEINPANRASLDEAVERCMTDHPGVVTGHDWVQVEECAAVEVYRLQP